MNPHNVMTRDRLQNLIEEGWGQGRNEFYGPWIRVRRKLSSPISNVFAAIVSSQTRPVHLLSSLEYSAALVAAWLGAVEIREQFPLWPYPFIHPFAGLDASIDRLLSDPPGLVRIARDAGIAHGNYVGTKLPFVATTDLVIRTGNHRNQQLAFWSCKPHSKLEAPDSVRLRERITLEKKYAEAVDSYHCEFTDKSVPLQLSTNLDWLAPLPSEAPMLTSDRLADFAAHLLNVGPSMPLARAIDYAGLMVGEHEHLKRALLFRCAAWAGLLHMNLARPILMQQPLKPDREWKLKAELRVALLGEKDGL